MAGRKVVSKRGVPIEIWTTCFRVSGTHQTLSIGKDFTDDQVIRCVDAIYERCMNDATQKAKRELKGHINQQLDKLLRT